VCFILLGVIVSLGWLLCFCFPVLFLLGWGLCFCLPGSGRKVLRGLLCGKALFLGVPGPRRASSVPASHKRARGFLHGKIRRLASRAPPGSLAGICGWKFPAVLAHTAPLEQWLKNWGFGRSGAVSLFHVWGVLFCVSRFVLIVLVYFSFLCVFFVVCPRAARQPDSTGVRGPTLGPLVLVRRWGASVFMLFSLMCI